MKKTLLNLSKNAKKILLSALAVTFLGILALLNSVPNLNLGLSSDTLDPNFSYSEINFPFPEEPRAGGASRGPASISIGIKRSVGISECREFGGEQTCIRPTILMQASFSGRGKRLAAPRNLPVLSDIDRSTTCAYARGGVTSGEASGDKFLAYDIESKNVFSTEVFGLRFLPPGSWPSWDTVNYCLNHAIPPNFEYFASVQESRYFWECPRGMEFATNDGKVTPYVPRCLVRQELTCNSANPVQAGMGTKLFQEIDLVSSGLDNLKFERTWRSQLGASEKRDLGRPNWTHNWARYISNSNSLIFDKTAAVKNRDIVLITENGDTKVFRLINVVSEVWHSTTNPVATINLIRNVDGRPLHLVYRDQETSGTDYYHPSGRLMKVVSKDQVVTDLKYSALRGGVVTQNDLLLEVKSSVGKSFNFSYSSDRRIVKVALTYFDKIQNRAIEIDSVNFRYEEPEYSLTPPKAEKQAQLTTAAYSSGKVINYYHESQTFPELITGIQNELKQRIATVIYDGLGRVSTSQLYNGSERLDFSYSTDGRTNVRRYGPEGTTTDHMYQFSTVGSLILPTSVSAPCTLCGVQHKKAEYNDDGTLKKSIGFSGDVTFYSYNSSGLMRKAVYPSEFADQTIAPSLANAKNVESISKSARSSSINISTATSNVVRIQSLRNTKVHIPAVGATPGFDYNVIGFQHLAAITNDQTGSAGYAAAKLLPYAVQESWTRVITSAVYNKEGLTPDETFTYRRLDFGETSLEGKVRYINGNLFSITDNLGQTIYRADQFDAFGRAKKGVLFGLEFETTQTPNGRILKERVGVNEIEYGYLPLKDTFSTVILKSEDRIVRTFSLIYKEGTDVLLDVVENGQSIYAGSDLKNEKEQDENKKYWASLLIPPVNAQGLVVPLGGGMGPLGIYAMQQKLSSTVNDLLQRNLNKIKDCELCESFDKPTVTNRTVFHVLLHGHLEISGDPLRNNKGVFFKANSVNFYKKKNMQKMVDLATDQTLNPGGFEPPQHNTGAKERPVYMQVDFTIGLSKVDSITKQREESSCIVMNIATDCKSYDRPVSGGGTVKTYSNSINEVKSLYPVSNRECIRRKRPTVMVRQYFN